MSEHEQLCNLIADLISEQARTTEAVTKLAEALAGVRAATVAKVEATKVIEKAKAEPVAAIPASVEKQQVTTAPIADLTYAKDVGPTMAKLLAAKGAATVKELLNKYGVKRGMDIPTDKLAAALADATAALES